MELLVGRQQILNGFVTIRANDDGSLSLDRVEVPEELRRNGEATRIINSLAEIAKKSGQSLTAQIAPDSEDYEVTLGLRRAFERAGFKVLKMDGESYPNDLEFNPF